VQTLPPFQLTPSRALLASVAISCLSLSLSCGSGDDETPVNQCVTLPATCPPGITPSYSEIYTTIFAKSCGATGSGPSCHGPDGRQGGLGLYDVDGAYSDLLGMTGGHARVLPEKPQCSILVERLNSDDPTFRMPYMELKLDPGLLCAVQTWIQNGALKD
jgi:hypothetical protein